MGAFEKPDFTYNYRVSSQIKALWEYRNNKPGRAIPEKRDNRLLLATWNIANLGVQERRDKDYQLLAELISWFDLIAIQEVNDNLEGLRAVQSHLPNNFQLLFTDPAGNNERMCCIYDNDKITLLEKVGEVSIPPSQLEDIKLPGITQKFLGFDRTPHVVAFQSNDFKFVLANVHLFRGKENTESRNRRSLETFAVARWSNLRLDSDNSYTKDIIVLGDFNLPKKEPGDPIYDALTLFGLHLPEHSMGLGTSIETDGHYDQIAFFPGQTMDEFTGESGVFDIDGPLFKTLWRKVEPEDFYKYMRYYVSDHRIFWAEFKTQN